MQPRGSWGHLGWAILVGAIGGWAVAHAQFDDVRLQVAVVMVVAVAIVITIGVLGRLLPGGREAKFPTARFAVFATGYLACVALSFYISFPVKSWVLLAVAALGLLLLFLRHKMRGNP